MKLRSGKIYSYKPIDKKIESIENQKINQIFKIKGETYFRELEFNITNQSLKDHDKIISLGGGAFMNKELRKIIKQKGFWKDIFYTDENTLDPRSDSEILIENIINDYNIKKKEITNTNTQDLKENIKVFINKNIRCLGIIKSGAQCARTRKCNSNYCKIHQKTLKFGKIIQPNVDSPE